MPIKYDVLRAGHFVKAVASGIVTEDEWIEYEVRHTVDDRIKPPLCELLRIDYEAYRNFTKDGLLRALENRKNQDKRPVPHRCAVVVTPGDVQGWSLTRLYEGLRTLHYPESVILFGEDRMAMTWLGFEEAEYPEPAALNPD
jgi:hypothetical protein